MDTIAQRYRRAQDVVADRCAACGRNPAELRIVAVSKTVDLPMIAEARAAGIHDFGENRTLLFRERSEAFPQENWHFIGRIQTNKVKDFVGRASLVHSVASERALRAIDRRAAYLGITQALLLEVNVSGEESKDGLKPDELDAALTVAAELGNVDVQGLMTMAPRNDAAIARETFRGLRLLRDEYASRYVGASTIHLLELSMGMSEDYPIAVEEGATILRLGRTLFSDSLH